MGGAQETVMYTAAYMDPNYYKVDVLSGPQTGSEGSLIEEVRNFGLNLFLMKNLVREINPYHDFLVLWKMYKFFKEHKPDIVHTNSSKAGIIGRIAAKFAGVPVIVHTVHGWSFHDHMSSIVRRIYVLLEKITAGFSDALIVVTDQDIDKGLKVGIGKREKYHLIRSAISLDEFSPDKVDRESVRKSLGLSPDVPVLGNIGRFSPQKNPLDWVRVASIVSKAIPECRFLLVGDGPLRGEVESLLEKENLAHRTILTGLRRDVPQMLGAIDVFLLTSLWEGLPRVIPQSMAMEVPVVANCSDGTVEAIMDGETGFLGTITDLDGMASYCIKLLTGFAG